MTAPTPLRVAVSARATEQIVEAVDWWRANRPLAPRLIDEELADAFARIAVHPESGIAVVARPGVRRVVLRASGYLLFYRVRPRLRRIEVVAFWHGRRGAAPP